MVGSTHWHPPSLLSVATNVPADTRRTAARRAPALLRLLRRGCLRYFRCCLFDRVGTKCRPLLSFLCVTLFQVAPQYNKLCRAILDIERFRSRYGCPARRKFSLATDMCRCCQRPWALVVVSTATWRCITAAMHDSAATGLAMDHQLQPRPPWWPP